MSYECRYCGDKFEKLGHLGGHTNQCLKNPRHDDIISRLSKLQYKRENYTMNCKRCQKQYVVNITKNSYEKGKYTKYCSRYCANSRKHTKEENEKTSKSLQGRTCPRKGISRRKELIKILFEPNCFFCKFQPKEKGQWTVIHKKDGKEHKIPSSWNIKDLQMINPNDYVRLCGRCHVNVHWCMKYLKMNWKDIEDKYRTIE